MAAESKYFRPGQCLFKEGEPSGSMYLIQKGTVGIRKMKGTEHVEIARVHANEVIGELSFFDRLPRSASAVALSEVEALEIQFEALDKVYINVPDSMKTIIASVADRLRKANDQIQKLQKETVTEDGEAPAADSELTASDILAATADIDLKGSKS